MSCPFVSFRVAQFKPVLESFVAFGFDSAQWPCARVAQSATAPKPDLVLHIGATQWLEELSTLTEPGDEISELKVPLREWARRRIVRLHEQLKLADKGQNGPDGQHRVRILAKRMRYGIETLSDLLPKQRAKLWRQQATRLQLSLGYTREVMQASVLAKKLQADRGLFEFLRGIAVGQTRPW
jgi:CHAD domain-containing protein